MQFRRFPRGRLAPAALALALHLLATGGVVAENPATSAGMAPLDIPQVPRLRALDFTSAAAAMAALQPDREAEILKMVQSGDLAALNAAMAQGKLTSVELTSFFLARIARHDDELRAYLEVNPTALDDAAAADAAFRAGQNGGLLQGIPMALKDNIETAAPMHTTANAAILLDNLAAGDAEIVTRLRSAGAVILGKASLSEFAGAVSGGKPSGGSGAVGGQTMNPLGPYPTYGSSAGSAVAVSALLAQVAVGTETSGSLIAPATGSSVVALKPTKGSVPGTGIIPLISHNDVAGPMGRSVADVAALHAVLAGPEAARPDFSLQAFQGVKLGILTADIAADPHYAAVQPAAISALTALGAQISPAELTDPTGQIAAFALLIAAGVRYEVIPYIQARHPEIASVEDLVAWNAAQPATRMPLGQDLLQIMAQLSAELTGADHEEFGTALEKAASDALEKAMAVNGVEVLVSTSSNHAPYYATAGWPAVTVPMGATPEGWPMGVTLIGRKGTDARLLELAWALERATQARLVPDVAKAP